MRELNLRPQGGGVNTAVKNKDSTVTLNNKLTLDKQGQEKIFDTKYKYNEGKPYLDKYGDYYAGKDDIRTKGGNVASFKNGYVSFKDKQYNRQDQERIFNDIRNLSQNKDKEFYLKGSTNPKYSAPNGYQYNKTKVNPLNSIS